MDSQVGALREMEKRAGFIPGPAGGLLLRHLFSRSSTDTGSDEFRFPSDLKLLSERIGERSPLELLLLEVSRTQSCKVSINNARY